jgi:hypothetical protein
VETIAEIKKYLKKKGWKLRIWEEWGDLVGATLWCIDNSAIHIGLNDCGKFSIGQQGSRKKAYLCAAKKALWFAKKYLKEVENDKDEGVQEQNKQQGRKRKNRRPNK